MRHQLERTSHKPSSKDKLCIFGNLNLGWKRCSVVCLCCLYRLYVQCRINVRIDIVSGNGYDVLIVSGNGYNLLIVCVNHYNLFMVTLDNVAWCTCWYWLNLCCS